MRRAKETWQLRETRGRPGGCGVGAVEPGGLRHSRGRAALASSLRDLSNGKPHESVETDSRAFQEVDPTELGHGAWGRKWKLGPLPGFRLESQGAIYVDQDH